MKMKITIADRSIGADHEVDEVEVADVLTSELAEEGVRELQLTDRNGHSISVGFNALEKAMVALKAVFHG